MAVAVIGTPTESATTSPPNPYTFSHTVASDTSLLLVVVGAGDAGNRLPTAVSWNSLSLTNIFEEEDGNWVGVSVWYRLSPSPATANVSVTCPETVDQIIVGAINLSGAAQSSTFGTPATDSNTGGTVASVQINSGTGEMAFFAVMSDSGASITPTGTDIFEVENVGGDTAGGAQHYAGASTVTGTWNQSENTGWAIGGVSIRPTGAGPEALPAGAAVGVL